MLNIKHLKIKFSYIYVGADFLLPLLPLVFLRRVSICYEVTKKVTKGVTKGVTKSKSLLLSLFCA